MSHAETRLTADCEPTCRQHLLVGTEWLPRWGSGHMQTLQGNVITKEHKSCCSSSSRSLHLWWCFPSRGYLHTTKAKAADPCSVITSILKEKMQWKYLQKHFFLQRHSDWPTLDANAIANCYQF